MQRQNRFSHIYLEEQARDNALTQRVLARFPGAEIIPLVRYQQVFGRPRQAFQVQKQSRKLILAVKPDDYLYPGSERCQDFGFDNFFYTTPMLNCPHDCDYCYLQGLLPSANLVMFVNTADFLQATAAQIAARRNRNQPLYVCISYDTDLLAVEPLAGYCREWIAFADGRDDLVLEIRTKSAAYPAIADLPAVDNVILAWTVSPNAVRQRYEHHTPPLAARLRAAAAAVDDGWPVRLCFDPVLAVPDWREVYAALVDTVFAQVAADRLRDVSIGSFRMAKVQFDRIRKDRPDCDLYHGNTVVDGAAVGYSNALRKRIVNRLKELVGRFLPANRIACSE